MPAQKLEGAGNRRAIMTDLNPQPPFIWPEPRVLEGICTYAHQPPLNELALTSKALFGIVSALTVRGVELLQSWLDHHPDLQAKLIVVVYPTCATRKRDFHQLLDLVHQLPNRLSIHIHPLDQLTDRATNALCFLSREFDMVHFAIGVSEDFGLEASQDHHIDFVFRPEPVLVESFKRYFDWLWAKSPEITAQGVALIPDLVIPEGTENGERLWREYVQNCTTGSVNDVESVGAPRVVTIVDPETGELTIQSEGGENITPPTEEFGLSKLDRLAEQVARIYEKGSLVSIDKLSRIPPLDAPLDPTVFGDAAELQNGNVTRRVSMRVSIIDAEMLKEIDKRRQGLRALLGKFTFGLADNIRWMPNTARGLFETELRRLNEEGQNLISELLKGDVDAFINSKREALVTDINGIYQQLGRSGQVSNSEIDNVIKSLKTRLSKTQGATFMPTLSYSAISFACTENALSSPWGQAFSLLSDIAKFQRKAITDGFFFFGLKVSDDDLFDAMNVADDALCRCVSSRGIKDRCKTELDLLSRIEKASMESQDRCELVLRILAGDSFNSIEQALNERQAK
jgi:hypothetical protein